MQRRRSVRTLTFCLFLAGSFLLVQTLRQREAAAKPAVAVRDQAAFHAVRGTFSELPLYFIENRGQLPSEVAYHARLGGTGIAFAATRVAFTLTAGSKGPVRGRAVDETSAREHHDLALRFVHADPGAGPIAADQTSAVVSYFSGSREHWRRGLKTYSRLVYRDLWPGIDLVYSGSGNRLKYTFNVRPGAEPDLIRLAYEGATTIRPGADGALEAVTPLGVMRDETPVVYQESNGARLAVAARYVIHSAGSKNEFGFRVGEYDRSKTLVIDPVVVYAGFVGTSFDDRGLGVAADTAGSAYVTGQTLSLDASSIDAYVAKVKADGSGFDYFMVLGGSSFDAGFDITVDDAGNAYVTGAADSADFPVTVGPDLTQNGSSDAFIAKIDPAGTSLVYSGFIGGNGFDFAEGVALDSSGRAYVTGPATSTESSLPVLVGPDLTQNGGFDIFVARVTADGSGLEYCGYIGGLRDDAPIVGNFVSGGHIAVDGANNAYISGSTKSSQATFPDGDGFGSVTGFDQTINGRTDAFIVKVSPSGSGLSYATYIGGRGADFGFGMAVDSAGNAHMTGDTSSSEQTFPVTAGPSLTYQNHGDAFVVKLDASGTGLLYAGYIGGRALDQGLGLALDADGNVYVAGHTHSSEASFPASGGPDLTFNGARSHGDAFIAKVTPAGVLEYAGYVGGDGEDAAFWVALDPAGNVYLVGETDSDQTTFPDGDGIGGLPGPDQTQNGSFDGFVVKISP